MAREVMSGKPESIGDVLERCLEEIRIRSTLTPEELIARTSRQKAEREAEISRAIGRPHTIRSEF